MKKKVMIPVIIVVVLLLGVIGYLIYSNNKVVSTITMDINPSIEIRLKKGNIVKSVVPLNDDARRIVGNELNGKSFDDVISVITNKVIENGYVKNDNITILISSNGNIDKDEIQNKVTKSFREKEIGVEVIRIDNITKEDQELAKKYNITPAKAAYINSIENIDTKELINKPIDELNDTKQRGVYCNAGYNLEGDFCFKEIGREAALNGMVCASNYYEYENNCYEEVPADETGKLICHNDSNLVDDKCVRTFEVEAIPAKYSCPSGVEMTKADAGFTDSHAGDANDIICVDPSTITHPVQVCNLPKDDKTERMTYNGKCYWHRAPVIASGCPGKKQVNGFCWDDASGIYVCPYKNNGIYYSSGDAICSSSLKYTNPNVTEYRCENDYVLNGKKCLKEEIEDPEREKACPNGYKTVDNDRCIKEVSKVGKINGYYCEKDNSRLDGDICIIYDIIDANRN